MYESAEDKIKSIKIKDYQYLKPIGYGNFGIVSIYKGKTHNIAIKVEGGIT